MMHATEIAGPPMYPQEYAPGGPAQPGVAADSAPSAREGLPLDGRGMTPSAAGSGGDRKSVV